MEIIITLEELTALVIVVYLLSFASLILGLHIVYELDKMKVKKQKKDFKDEIVNEILSHFERKKGG